MEPSKGRQAAAAKGDFRGLGRVEAQIDRAAATVWGLTGDELKAIEEALAETGKSKRPAKEDEED